MKQSNTGKFTQRKLQGMIGSLSRRIQHIYLILFLPLYRRLILGVLTILGAIDTIRSDVFHAMPNVPNLPVSWWIVLFFLTLVVFIVEASYKRFEAERAKQSDSGPTAPERYADGGSGGELSAYGSGFSGSVSGGEGGEYGNYRGGTGGSAAITGGANGAGVVCTHIRGGRGGGVGDSSGRGAMGARSPMEENGSSTATWMYGCGGNGGNHPEFDRRVKVLLRFIDEYFVAFPDRATFIRAGIDLMPENWINKRLEEEAESWRVEQRDGRFIMPNLE